MFVQIAKKALATAALTSALVIGAGAPASAFSLFGFDSASQSPAAQRRFTVRPFDGGGNVFSYYGRARVSYARTVIAGVCASACTMKLASQNVCVEPDATLLFHQASYNGVRSEIATRMMLSSYPSRIRHWVMRNGALNSSALTGLSGRQAIAMGVRPC
ncbi:hypothetical protein M2323_004590 [Rhodoblastus acidophilus]|uniref:hypothetical protein n=1 Tax=Rhodoblastus acidophilus TaxID=1074 RepID=UPI0022246134|nr:hypothetical protein [Rhodoblastus acidophilus]MCW2283824.1 hypothetical protein [Rhodoblastus acidophilus]MCW2335638.1 hypothetical protein [Rhodoblastus acidophilus]